MRLAYAGIGSRKTPDIICHVMTAIAKKLESEGYVLRSGHADGADMAFELGVKSRKEIYLPWKGFNGSDSEYHNPSIEAYKLAEKYHPNWNSCSHGVKALLARNCHQILGATLTHPVAGVICWTRDGGFTGGTGQALRIAEAYRIKIYNLHSTETMNTLYKYATGETV